MSCDTLFVCLKPDTARGAYRLPQHRVGVSWLVVGKRATAKHLLRCWVYADLSRIERPDA